MFLYYFIIYHGRAAPTITCETLLLPNHVPFLHLSFPSFICSSPLHLSSMVPTSPLIPSLDPLGIPLPSFLQPGIFLHPPLLPASFLCATILPLSSHSISSLLANQTPSALPSPTCREQLPATLLTTLLTTLSNLPPPAAGRMLQMRATPSQMGAGVRKENTLRAKRKR